MRAEEFYKQRSNSVRELWVLSPKQIEYIALIMEEYAALRIHDAVGRIERLVNFLLYLNDKELINNYDFDYEKEAKKYLKKK